MTQLNQQSRWQSWMRMLSVYIQSVPESASLIGPAGSDVSAGWHAAIEGSTSLGPELTGTFLNVGR